MRVYLPGQAGLSENTIMAYRDTFIQILYFIENIKKKNPDQLTLTDFNFQLIVDFLDWLETDRHNSISTRNQRLAAIRAFAKYARSRYPEFMFELQKISDIRTKKHPKPELAYLTPDEIKAVLESVSTDDQYGRRDLALLTLLYDSAARVQEICDLRVRDVRLQKPYTIKLTGKGQKTRWVPVMN
ncbi:MAG: tyrosine-type recombinase/integrase, partial [Lachnospiraceae bacterium]|nr:tyrosine-type recombinase/integrase [Lachnospiraceae bacterium]